MILIFCEQVSERLIYTFNFIFGVRDIAYKICNDPIIFDKESGLKLNYSERNFEGVQSIKPSTLLFQIGLPEQVIRKAEFKQIECLAFDEVIDPIASIFYVLSRCEEYTCHIRDKHNRFLAKDSILLEFGWLFTPICDFWACYVLNDFFPDLKYTKPPFKIVPTFDIDSSYAYLQKNEIRNKLSTWRDGLSGKKELATERKSVRAGEIKDPFDTYDYIEQSIQALDEVYFFWLLGNYASFDRNISHLDPVQKELIKRMKPYGRIGTHPSYASNDKPYLISVEKDRLEAITEESVLESRQHYLKLNLPQTYRKLIGVGIQKDFTMGFADMAGFRMGTAHNLPWFDLLKNETSKLQLYPFAYMDGTLNQYMKLNPEQALGVVKQLKKEIQHYGGHFSFIWHNETLNNRGIWENWKAVFEESLRP